MKNIAFRRRKFLVIAFEWFMVLAGGSIIILAVYLVTILSSLPSPEEFDASRVTQSTKIYDRTGKVLLYEVHGEERRTVVPFEEIPAVVRGAALAAEDAHFYSNPAFNWKSMLRALIANVREGRVTQGGSTITQQLAKAVFLSPERTVARKLKELILAVRLEAKYSKDEILGFYLNQIPFGSNAYGVEAASQMYFGVSVRDLTAAQAASLVGLIPAPTYYSPWGTHREELLARKSTILNRMAELGMLGSGDLTRVLGETVVFSPPSLGAIRAPHFVLMVREYLAKRYGEEVLAAGGLQVVTTLDWEMQEKAERAVAEGVERNVKLYGSHNGALVAQDPKTGQLLALVGSKNYFGDPEPGGCTPGSNCLFEGNFNVATQGLRQPGSALKPFVYLAAFERGYLPETVVFDVPTEFDVRSDPEKSYRPGNFDDVFLGPVSMADALAQSRNVPAVKTLYLAGIGKTIQKLSLFGITTLRDTWRYGLSLTLGGGEVYLRELVNAYGTLANEGVRHDQAFILSVSDVQGTPLEVYEDTANRVIDPEYPRRITDILKDPVRRATLFQASLPLTVFEGHEVALKTGTTQDYRDAWAFGYTPSLVVGVWAGNNNNAAMTSRGSSILAAVPMWSSFLRSVIGGYPTDELFTPAEPREQQGGAGKPMVGGSLGPEPHSILHYVDTDDPLGPEPENPSSNPQYAEWERGVLNWVSLNPIEFPPSTSLLSAQNTAGDVVSTAVTFTDVRPGNGEWASSPVPLNAVISSPLGIRSIEVSLDGVVVNSFGITSQQYRYTYEYAGKLKPQNTLRFRVVDASGAVATNAVVFYAR